MRKMKQITASLLVLAMVVCTALSGAGVSVSSAAKKPKLSRKTVTITAGKTKTLTVKNAKKAKVTWKSKNKKIVKVTKKGRLKAKLKGIKKGKTTVTAKVKIKNKSVTLKCKVTVNKKKNVNPTKQPVISKTPVTTSPSMKPTTVPTTPAITPSENPSTAPSESPSVAPSTVPSESPSIAPSESPSVAPSFEPVVFKTAGFETGVDGFTGRGGQESLSSVADGYEGKCLYVTGRTLEWHGAKIDVTDTIKTGATYSVVAYMKQTSGTTLQVKCSAETDGNYPAIALATAASGEWTKLEGTITIPNSFNDFSIYFEIPANATADFYLDSVEIKQITEAVEPVELPSILEAYQDIFPYMGTCLNYYGYRSGGTNQLTTAKTVEFVKKHFNSFTLEDEMKPNSVLGSSATRITKAAAETKGYTLPENYTEQYVPQLNFDTLDKTLEAAHTNNLKMRAHTLMWHQQTPAWFFTENYNGSTVNAKTDAATMDARLEFYVRTVMKHIMAKEKELTGGNGSIVYAWDVTNEYTHRTNDPATVSWMDVYGDQGLQPSYVKKAYQFAYEELTLAGVEDTVTLFYNDYNTYNEADDIISLIDFINEGEPEKICKGVGMQSHLDIDYPSIALYGQTIDKFKAKNLEIQITELDVTINFNGSSGQTDSEQAAYMGDLMDTIIAKKRAGANITGITVWGLFDSISWRKEYAPLLFGAGIGDPKESFYAFIEAAKSTGA